MAATTLALAQSSYQLLDLLGDGTSVPGSKPAGLKASGASSVNLLSTIPGPIVDLGVGGSDQSNTLNITSSLADFQADMGGGNDILNILGSVDGGRNILLGSGNDKLLISQDLFDAHVNAGTGNDEVRINGSVSNAEFLLDAGGDTLVIGNTGRNASNVYINTGADNDYLEVRGGSNDLIAQTASGDDNVLLRGELFGSAFGAAGIDLGDGNDRLNLGNGATNADISTGLGSDTVVLSGSFQSTRISNPGGSDQFSIAAGSTFFNSSLQSQDSSGTNLVGGKGVIFSDSSFAFGVGNDNLSFGGATNFYNTVLSLGSGADAVSFGKDASFSNFTLDLGGNDGVDTIRLLDSSLDQSQFVIQNASKGDILYIGSNVYYYAGSGSLAETTGWLSGWGATKTT